MCPLQRVGSNLYTVRFYIVTVFSFSFVQFYAVLRFQFLDHLDCHSCSSTVLRRTPFPVSCSFVLAQSVVVQF